MKKKILLMALMVTVVLTGCAEKEKVVSVSTPHLAQEDTKQEDDTGTEGFDNDTSQAKEDAMQEIKEEPSQMEEADAENKTEATDTAEDETLSVDMSLVNKGLYLVTDNGSDDNGSYVVANEYAIEKDADGNDKLKDSGNIYIEDSQLLNAIVLFCKGKTDIFLKPVITANDAGVNIMTDYEFVDGTGNSIGKIDSVLNKDE